MKFSLKLCCILLTLHPRAAAYSASVSYSAGSADPAPTAQSWVKAPPAVFQAPLAPSYPPETGTFNAFNSATAAWEIFDVQDNGNNTDGAKSNSEYYYQSAGDQSNVDWVLSFTTSVRDGAYQDFISQKTAQTNAFQYQVYEGLNSSSVPVWDLWRVEFAVVNNGNGTFDLAVLGRESFSGAPAASPGPSTVLLNDVSQAIAEAFYEYELRYSAVSEEASLWQDTGSGMSLRLSGIKLNDTTGVPAAIATGGLNVVAWGNVSDLAGGHMLVKSVDFVAVPEPSAACLALLSAAIISLPHRRVRR